MKIEKLYDMAERFCQKETESEGKIIKTIPTTKEEQDIMEEGRKIILDIGKRMEKLQASKKKFWATFGVRTNLFGGYMNYNSKTKEVEVREDGKDSE